MKNKTWLCFPAIQAAAIIQTVSAVGWTEAAATAALAWGMLLLPRAKNLPGWIKWLQSIWNGVLAGVVMRWLSAYWPGEPVWAAGVILALAVWQTGKGQNAVAAAASVLGILQLLLIAGVLLTASKNMEWENLRADGLGINGWLLTVLLLPALGREEESRSVWPALWTLAICLVTSGVVPRGAIPAGGNAFWEMSKSVSVFGKIKRLESLTAVGLSLGFYLLACFLLGGGKEKRGIRWLPVLLAGAILLAQVEIAGIHAAIASVFLWILLPAMAAIYEKKE